ncbi:alpha-1 [Rhynchosporium secalis]|uniref:Alpha-1 n=1 Tax=Rhynchosporium secalis TaxID=38038 RepID=A0A1E1MVD9_RHYSE|nr:alpha-1 [Rhynchosporium secalis]
MAVARPLRMLGLCAVGLWIFFLYRTFGPTRSPKGPGDTLENMDRDPTLDLTGEPESTVLWRADQGYGLGAAGTNRINATLLSLVRNEEVDGMVQAMRDLERTWNRKFNYPWTFFNDVPFSEEFKRRTQAETKAECIYEVIPKEHWEVPSWIDEELFQESAKILKENDIQYGAMKSYHQMCRWNSGLFYKHPALANTQFYWRVEPKVHFFCDVDYDVFRYMADNNKTYGFTINLYDAPNSIPTLWPETTKFVAAHPEYLHDNNAMQWLSDAKRRPEHNMKANGYSTCHFWSNFEIADMSFWRSQAYEDYFNHLDRAGGFFYERWGDAPVHSIALGLFEDSSKIHWFRDIGYQHIPYFNCPNSPKCKGCTAGRFTDGESWLMKEDCRPNWFKYVGMGTIPNRASDKRAGGYLDLRPEIGL